MSTIAQIDAQRIPAEDLTALSACAERLADPHLQELVHSIVRYVEGGIDMTLLRSDAELTPNQVAAQLQMSRSHIYKLIDSGVLPSHRVGRDRRLRLTDVLAFEEQRQRDRRELAERFAHPDATRAGAIDELLAQM